MPIETFVLILNSRWIFDCTDIQVCTIILHARLGQSSRYIRLLCQQKKNEKCLIGTTKPTIKMWLGKSILTIKKSAEQM